MPVIVLVTVVVVTVIAVIALILWGKKDVIVSRVVEDRKIITWLVEVQPVTTEMVRVNLLAFTFILYLFMYMICLQVVISYVVDFSTLERKVLFHV